MDGANKTRSEDENMPNNSWLPFTKNFQTVDYFKLEQDQVDLAMECFLRDSEVSS